MSRQALAFKIACLIFGNTEWKRSSVAFLSMPHWLWAALALLHTCTAFSLRVVLVTEEAVRSGGRLVFSLVNSILMKHYGKIKIMLAMLLMETILILVFVPLVPASMMVPHFMEPPFQNVTSRISWNYKESRHFCHQENDNRMNSSSLHQNPTQTSIFCGPHGFGDSRVDCVPWMQNNSPDPSWNGKAEQICGFFRPLCPSCLESFTIANGESLWELRWTNHTPWAASNKIPAPSAVTIWNCQMHREFGFWWFLHEF